MGQITGLTGSVAAATAPRAATTATTAAAATTGPQMPGKTDFLQLLVAELRHQDPMKPMEDRDFVTQLAQFNSLEQMQQINKGIEAFSATQDVMEAASLLGKWVAYKDGSPNSDSLLSGLVNRVSWETGSPKLSVNNKEVDLTQIVSVE